LSAEFQAELRNLPNSTEFLRFCGILQNSVLAGEKWSKFKYGIFWSGSGGGRNLITIRTRRHDGTVK